MLGGLSLLMCTGMAQAAPSQVTPEPAIVPSTADRAALDGIKTKLESRFPGIEIAAVSPTPFSGLYEVQIGMDLVYTDVSTDYLLQGSLIDTKSRTDLTAERLVKLSSVPFDSLPLKLAVKQVKGTGARVMAVFEDPNCGYCKLLHKNLAQIDDTTIYTFLFPVLSPDSEVKARNIWCAKDQAVTWRDWMLDAKVPPQAECDTPVKEVLALGRKLRVQGTPAIFFEDGSRVNGALPLAAMREKLDTLN